MPWNLGHNTPFIRSIREITEKVRDIDREMTYCKCTSTDRASCKKTVCKSSILYLAIQLGYQQDHKIILQDNVQKIDLSTA